MVLIALVGLATAPERGHLYVGEMAKPTGLIQLALGNTAVDVELNLSLKVWARGTVAD